MLALAALVACLTPAADANNGQGPPATPPGQGGSTPPGQAVQPVQAVQPAATEPPGQVRKAAGTQPPGQTRKAASTQTKAAPPTKTAQTTTTSQAGTAATAQPPASQSSAPASPPGQARNSPNATPPGQASTAPITTTTTPTAAPAAAPTTSATSGTTRRRTRSATTRRSTTPARRTTLTATPVAAALVAGTGATAPATSPAATPTGPGATPTSTTPARHRVAARTPVKVSQPQSRGPVRVVTNTVRDIAHVIPGWVKALLAALAVLLAVAAALILAAALRNRRLSKQRALLLADVGALQAALLPVVPDHVGDLAVTVAYRPADGLAAGGDFYDVFPLDEDRVGILVGDVSGHGRESRRAATFTRHMVRAYLEAGLGPREALQVAGNVVDQHEAEEDFATLIAAVHDPTAGTLSYASAGHPPPIVLGPAAHKPMIVASSPPLGVGSPTGLRQTTLPLPAGSTVCLFTDGLLEARIGHSILGRMRLESIATELGTEISAPALVERVEREADVIRDDVAVCVIRVAGDAPAAGTVRVEELEVAAAGLEARRVRRFLRACGLTPPEVESVMATARARAGAEGAVLLRVRLARDRSGVDVLPVQSAGHGAPVAALANRRAAGD